jgi:hypothetical protein
MFEKKETGAENTAAPEKKIDRETAESEFVRFCENNEIECDESQMNEDERDSFLDHKNRFLKACMNGRVEVDGTSIKYTVSKFSSENFRGETITISRPGGQAFSVGDSFKDRENVKKLNGFMSAMTGKDVGYFNKIDIADYKFFNAVASLFLSL